MSKRRTSSAVIVENINSLCFPVHRVDNPEWVNKKHQKIIVALMPDPNNPKKNKRKLLNYASSVYGLIPNSAIFPQIENVLNASNIAYNVTYKHVDNVEFYVDYRITDSRYTWKIEGTNDEIQMIISVQHSYDSSKKFKIFIGWFRFICNNGLVSPVKELEQYNMVMVVKHSTVVHKVHENINKLLLKIHNEAEDIITLVSRKFKTLADAVVTPDNFDKMLEQTLKAAGINAISNKNFNTYENIKNRAIAEANHPTLGYKGTLNEWLVYNAINQYINDDTLNVTNPETRRENDSKVLEYLLKRHQKETEQIS